MLAIRLRIGGYVFVYHQGSPIGAILIGQMSPSRSWVSLLFSGDPHEFEILRPEVVARRYGEEELEKLVERFALWTSQST